MHVSAFYVLMKYISMVTIIDLDDSPDTPDFNHVMETTIKMLNADQLAEIPSFVDHVLSTTHDSKALARVFEDGNSYRVWHSDEGPRIALLAIRDAALAAGTSPASRSSAR